MAKIKVQDTEVAVVKVNNEDYFCLTDMIKAKDGGLLRHRLVKKPQHT